MMYEMKPIRMIASTREPPENASTIEVILPSSPVTAITPYIIAAHAPSAETLMVPRVAASRAMMVLEGVIRERLRAQLMTHTPTTAAALAKNGAKSRNIR